MSRRGSAELVLVAMAGVLAASGFRATTVQTASGPATRLTWVVEGKPSREL